ncbi:MAG: ribosome-binding factor A [Candidatus Paceibacterota bacterium]
MTLYRTRRMESVMEQVLSEEIVRTIEDADTLITITNIHIDLENDQALVSVAVFPDEKREAVLGGLNRRAGGLAFMLLKKMKVKKIPFLVFV